MEGKHKKKKMTNENRFRKQTNRSAPKVTQRFSTARMRDHMIFETNYWLLLVS